MSLNQMFYDLVDLNEGFQYELMRLLNRMIKLLNKMLQEEKLVVLEIKIKEVHFGWWWKGL